MKILTVIQARMGSSRFPGKILKRLGSKTVLEVIVERVRGSMLSGEVVVATTNELTDNIIADLCTKNNIPVFRGSTDDLLDRHYQTGKLLDAEAVVKIPSDCPLIDPDVIDEVIRFFLDNSTYYDYVSNLHPATWPDGNDVEIMHMSVLEEAWRSATALHEREHTTPYIWENPDKFKVGNVVLQDNKDFSQTHRWTLDYNEDYKFIKSVYDILSPKNPLFTCEDILKLLEENPQLKSLNQDYLGEGWYKRHLENIKTLKKEINIQDK